MSECHIRDTMQVAIMPVAHPPLPSTKMIFVGSYLGAYESCMQLEVLPHCPVKDKAVLQGYFNAMDYMCYDTFEGTYHPGKP